MFAIFVLVSLFSHAQGISDGGQQNFAEDVLIFTIDGNKESSRPDCVATKRFAVHGSSMYDPVIIAAFNGGKKVGNVRGLG